MKRLVVVCAAFLVFVSAGCNVAKFMADQSPPMMDDQTMSFYQEASLQHAREAVPALLKLLDGFIVSSPKNGALLVRAAALYCGAALVLVEDEEPEYASVLYQKGYRYAIRALEQEVDDLDALLEGSIDALADALQGLEGDDLVGPVFWSGGCLGGWLNLNLEDAEAMVEIPKALAFIKRAEELDDTYYFGGPHLFLGIFNGMMGAAFGGLPEESRRHFERLNEINDERFLLGKVFFATKYAVQTQNRELFVRTLNEVIEAPLTIDIDLTLPNAAAKKKAEKLLEEVEDYFL